MKILISTNLREGKGLARDYELLRALLVEMGHHVDPAQFDQSTPSGRYDLGIVLERCNPTFPDHCDRTWLIPNPEWWDVRCNGLLPCFERVLCKTQHAVEVFEKLVGDRAEFIGWESADRLVASIPRQKAFLFNPGGSTARAHEAVLWCWERLGPHVPDLLVVGTNVQPRQMRGVRFERRLEDDHLQIEQNRCLFHLCPSSYEGWGHYIHEAESCKAIILTTDVEPMRGSIVAGAWVRAGEAKRQMLVETMIPDRDAVEMAIANLITLKPTEIADIGERARAAFLAERESFRAGFRELMTHTAKAVA